MSYPEKIILQKMRFYQEIILGIKNIVDIYAVKVLEENVNFFSDGIIIDDDYEVPKAIETMLHITQLDMKEFLTLWEDGLEKRKGGDEK